ncbi:Predicted ABC-type ATPase [Rhizobium sp. RU35A]|uniref:zeta toxin family protein n=1 Tax=Rhizobium sp. RU35A TaxID=1907414 RepID=UPI00095455DF|nr:zeta toxin family protein [Rhizobium sp. RU35A]SIQ92510.1 Predicted ABC-type ATPase [Rhizobium sp. RU35A]
MPPAHCIVLAGPNGSEKSSSFEALRPPGILVNVNDIARSLGSAASDSARAIRAGRMAIAQIEALIASRTSFTFETTLSSHHALDVMRQTRAAGFSVGLYYVILDTPARCIERVAFRIATGGHPIPPGVIVRRYEASLAHLREALRMADEVVIVDNSNLTPRILFEIKSAVLRRQDIERDNPLHDRLQGIISDAYGLAI